MRETESDKSRPSWLNRPANKNHLTEWWIVAGRQMNCPSNHRFRENLPPWCSIVRFPRHWPDRPFHAQTLSTAVTLLYGGRNQIEGPSCLDGGDQFVLDTKLDRIVWTDHHHPPKESTRASEQLWEEQDVAERRKARWSGGAWWDEEGAREINERERMPWMQHASLERSWCQGMVIRKLCIQSCKQVSYDLKTRQVDLWVFNYVGIPLCKQVGHNVKKWSLGNWVSSCVDR